MLCGSRQAAGLTAVILCRAVARPPPPAAAPCADLPSRGAAYTAMMAAKGMSLARQLTFVTALQKCRLQGVWAPPGAAPSGSAAQGLPRAQRTALVGGLATYWGRLQRCRGNALGLHTRAAPSVHPRPHYPCSLCRLPAVHLKGQGHLDPDNARNGEGLPEGGPLPRLAWAPAGCPHTQGSLRCSKGGHARPRRESGTRRVLTAGSSRWPAH